MPWVGSSMVQPVWPQVAATGFAGQLTSMVPYSIITAHNAAHSSSITVAILAQGTSWAVAVTQAFCCGWYIRTYISFETRKKNYPSLEVSAPKYSLAAQQ